MTEEQESEGLEALIAERDELRKLIKYLVPAVRLGRSLDSNNPLLTKTTEYLENAEKRVDAFLSSLEGEK